jgi:hypothetical protein
LARTPSWEEEEKEKERERGKERGRGRPSCRAVQKERANMTARCQREKKYTTDTNTMISQSA